MTPHLLGNRGKDLEDEVLRAIKYDPRVCGGRYGVMTYLVEGEWKPRKSLPDIEGNILTGRQFITEAKTVSDSSLQLANRISKDNAWKQLETLLVRADWNAITFYLIHFNQRQLKRRTAPAATYAFPVHPLHPFWRGFLRGDFKHINIQTCEAWGAIRVAWAIPPRCKKRQIMIADAIYELDHLLDEYRVDHPTNWRNAKFFNVEKTLF